MARKRNYAAENAAREARARELGFASDYDRRVRGGAGATPATPKPTGGELSLRAGHRGAAALKGAVREGDHVTILSTERGSSGRYTKITLSLFDARTGKETVYVLRGPALKARRIADLSNAISDAGATQSPDYPLEGFYAHEDLDDEDYGFDDYDLEDEDDEAA